MKILSILVLLLVLGVTYAVMYIAPGFEEEVFRRGGALSTVEIFALETGRFSQAHWYILLPAGLALAAFLWVAGSRGERANE